jgi:ABC-type sugar transport system ATPase subunit
MQITQTVADTRPADSNDTGLTYNGIDPGDLGLYMQGICKEFGGVKALDNVSFDVRPGEIHALIGQNGAGKSTLMGILSGSLKADAGQIKACGQSLVSLESLCLDNKDLAIVRQEFSLCPNLTIAENIFLGREPTTKAGLVDYTSMRTQTAAFLAKVHVELDPDCAVDTLGVSEWQIIEICKALAENPKFIIMDEPTAALGDDRIKDLLQIVTRLRKQGHGIVYISHKLTEILNISDRITVLRDGKVSTTLLNDGLNEDDLVNAMLGGVEITTRHQDDRPQPGAELLSVQSLGKDGHFDGVSFTLKQGEVLGIAGILGSGAADLVRSLFGIVPWNSGSVYISGVAAHINCPHDAIRAGFGYVPSDRKGEGLVLPLSVYENSAMTTIAKLGRMGFYNKKDSKNQTQKLIDRLGIKVANPGAPVANLSGGNQQKVSIGKWLAKECPILIFEEPTRGIDIHAKAQVWEIIAELASQNCGVIVVSNELPELIDGCDRMLIMRKGKVIDTVSRGDFSESKISVQLSSDV